MACFSSSSVIALPWLRLREQLLELVDDDDIDAVGGCVFAHHSSECLSIDRASRHPKLLQRIRQHRQRMLRGAEHRPAHLLVALLVVLLQRGNEARLRERRLAAATRAGDEEERPLLARGGQLGDGFGDLLLAPGVLLALGVGEGGQAEVGVSETAHVVGGVGFVDDVVLGAAPALGRAGGGAVLPALVYAGDGGGGVALPAALRRELHRCD